MNLLAKTHVAQHVNDATESLVEAMRIMNVHQEVGEVFDELAAVAEQLNELARKVLEWQSN